VINNALAGISHEISYDAVIKNNVVIGNGYNSIGNGKPGSPVWMWGGQIQIHNSPNVEVYGNYVDYTSSGNGITIIEEQRGSGNRGAYLARNEYIHDNILIKSAGNGVTGGESNINAVMFNSGNNVWSDNTFYMKDGGFEWDNSSTFSQFLREAGSQAGTLHAVTSAPSVPDLTHWFPGTADDAPSAPTPPPVETGGPEPAPTIPAPSTPTPTAPAPTEPAPSAPQPAPTQGAGATMNGNSSIDMLMGTGKNDVIKGNGGNDVLKGGSGDDTLYGGVGNDQITGGAGNDKMWGDGGVDRF
jgi:Ca2+-binding RTX toxin-like protein